MLNFLRPKDVVISISASGNSPNVLKAIRVAREQGAITVGLTGDTGGKLREMVDYCVMIPSDHIGRQEDGHMILDHVIANTLRKLIEKMP
jgi:D-sedoheptulose 7-phosphate isomerase